MGRILAGVLLLAACGDNGVEEPGVNVPGSVDTVTIGGDGAAARLAPAVCGELEWTTSGGNGAIEMSVIPRASGAQVLAVPLAGGAIDGYALDKSLNLRTVTPSISIDSGYTDVSASLVGTTLTATG